MAQHRANPIPDTLEHVPGLPDHVKIFKIPASSYWYTRASFDGKRVVHSLKTESHATAMAEAKKWYLQMLVKKAIGQPLTQASDFKRAADALLVDEKSRVKAGERKQSLVDDFEYIYDKDLLPFFKSISLRSIDKAKISEYLAHIGQRGLSSRTKKNHLMHLHKVLAKAEDLKLIDRIPSFPKVILQQSPREWFNPEQYTKLYRTIQKAIEDRVVIRGVPITDELLNLTEFMVGSFLRAADIKLLQHKHVTVVDKPSGQRLLRIMAKGKVAAAPVISTEAAASVYVQSLKQDDPEGYVFLGKYGRNHAMSLMAKQFKYVLEKAGLYEVDGSRQTRSLTSLRHTAIMRQLLNGGMNPATLAKNCRTSIEMLHKFYGSHVEAELAANQLYQESAPPDTLARLYRKHREAEAEEEQS